MDAVTASVVICVHNALDDVKRCIASVRKTDYAGPLELIIIDDGSDAPTQRYLAGLARRQPEITLIRRPQAGGYTVAANTGIRAATGEIIAMLNSDTIVPGRWLTKIAALFAAHPDVGIVGPLSNAASWQSVPERSAPEGGWAVNALPDGMSVDDVDAAVQACAQGVVTPRLPLVNGFCYSIRRAVVDGIGLLDEDAFPRGFGEEDDYCLRAANAGFGLMIALDTYVYHAKSKSYGKTKRNNLSARGQINLKSKHGEDRLRRATETMKINPYIAEMRARVGDALRG